MALPPWNANETLHPHLAEREVLVRGVGEAWAWIACRVVNRSHDGERIKVEVAPYDCGYKVWTPVVYLRKRQPHPDTPPWPEVRRE